MNIQLQEDLRDALQEISNISMGAAGETLAAFTDTFVELSIPKIRVIDSTQLTRSLSELNDAETMTVLAQSFYLDDTECYALVAVTEQSVEDVVAEGADNTDEELVRFGHAITDVCLERFADLVKLGLSTSSVYVVERNTYIKTFAFNEIHNWSEIISVEINYHLENHRFNCDLVLLFPSEFYEPLIDSLERLLAQ
ncbi:hypothetical protein [Sessilibacter sp. MAH2]